MAFDRLSNIHPRIYPPGYLSPNIRRRIGLAASTLVRLGRVWSNRRLRLSSKLRVYNTCVLPVLLYGSETWTLLNEDGRKLQAFHMRCQRQLLGYAGAISLPMSRSRRARVSPTSEVSSPKGVNPFGLYQETPGRLSSPHGPQT